jgi:predicted alpha/beta superfamily hydrolase
MIEKFAIPVTPLTGKEPRTVYVYLPKAAKDPEARFPVLYMFDGHNVFFDKDATFGKSWGMGKYLDRTKTPLIVVAVDCNHRLPFGRLSEYSPFPFEWEGFGKGIGRGTKFMNWLCNTLKPLIDERYPTLPGRETTYIAGSSMGGLMSLYAITAYNHVFSRAAALSPAVWIVHGRMEQLIRKSKYRPDTAVYLDFGQREFGGNKEMRRSFMDTVNALEQQDVPITCRIVPNGDHNEATWEEQIPFFMPVLFYSRK